MQEKSRETRWKQWNNCARCHGQRAHINPKRVRIWDGTVMAIRPSMPPACYHPNVDVIAWEGIGGGHGLP